MTNKSTKLQERRSALSPTGWDRRRIKHHLLGFFGGGTPSKDKEVFWTNGTIPWVSPKDMKSPKITTAEDSITPEAVLHSATNMVPPNSVLMVVRSGILKHSLPVAINTIPVALNQDMKAFRFRKTLREPFFAYWIEGQAKNLLLEWAQIGATVDNIDVDAMLNAEIPLPDPATQKAIAEFLDRETARIDQLIEKKQRLVALLREKWESVVENAISTGGKRAKLGYHIDILSGYAFPSRDFSTDPEDIPLLRGANVSPGSIRWDDTVYWSRDRLGEVLRFLLDAGDVVLGMDRPWVSSGIRVAELTEQDTPALLLQRVCRIEPRMTLDKQFMKLLLTSRQFLAYFEPIMTGVSVPHISPDQVSSFRFEYVERDEQVRRATAASRERELIIRVQQSAEKSIDRLKEYRSALITAAVTGQIDVVTYGKQGAADRAFDRIEEGPNVG